MIALLFLTLRRDEHNHSFAFEVRYVVCFAVLFEVGGKTRQKQFSLLFEDDGSSAEEDVGFDLIAIFEELLRMFELEVIVMIVGLRTETDLFDFLLLLVLLCLFLLFLLRVEEFLVVNNSAYRRVRGSSYLDQVEVLLIGDMHRLLKRVDALLYVFANEANLGHTFDLVVNTVRILFNNSTAARSDGGCCYSFFLLKIVNNDVSRAGTQCPTFEKADKITTKK